MNIAITIPGFSAHGGINVIIEWANQLSKWNQVTLITEKLTNNHWYPVSDRVRVTTDLWLEQYDCLIITSPHFSYMCGDLPELIYGQFTGKRYVFMQMLEHMFRPGDRVWVKKCNEFYHAPFPMFYISKWNYAELGRTNPDDVYVQNSINPDLFSFEEPEKDFKTVCVEGWEPTNQTKDINHLGAATAKYLKQKYGFHILSYGAKPIKFRPQACSEYYKMPNLERILDIYRRSFLLVKATVCDASSTVPFEAATKNCLTIRAISRGDDSLIHGYNCLKGAYKLDWLISACDEAIFNSDGRERMLNNFRDQLKRNSWEVIFEDVNDVLHNRCKKYG